MACYFALRSQGIYAFDNDSSLSTKVFCTTVDSLLLPITSIIAGVVGTALLIIKTIYLLVSHFVSGSLQSLSSRFSCITKSTAVPWLAPILLLPGIGTAIYLAVFVNSFFKGNMTPPSCIDASGVAACAPALLLVDLATSWEPKVLED